jgi:hypothetical protein
MVMDAQKTAKAARSTEGTESARHNVNSPRSSGSGRTWFRLHTEITASKIKSMFILANTTLRISFNILNTEGLVPISRPDPTLPLF